jgi:hypothetical protein
MIPQRTQSQITSVCIIDHPHTIHLSFHAILSNLTNTSTPFPPLSWMPRV